MGGRRKNLPDPFFFLVAALAVSACGVKGPPLPPLVRVPVAPADFVAERRGNRVEVRFVVPAENTDGSRPANIERVDVYALSGPPTISDELLITRGTRIGSVDVKAPRDPDDTVDPDEPIADVEPPEGPGLDQGATARVHEDLAAGALKPIDISEAALDEGALGPTPLAGPSVMPSRMFVGVGISTRGRRGPLSRRAVVALLPAPVPPPPPSVTYDETSITVTWTVPAAASVQAPASGDVLPATLFGMDMPVTAYHVYDVPPAPDPGSSAPIPQRDGSDGPAETRLTETPVTEARFVDQRIAWGVERCYAVRALQTLGGLSVESDASPPTCATLTDTFAPAAPTGLNQVPSEGAITLIWNPNAEADLAGYIVLRAPAPAGTLTPITSEPIQLTTFRDTVPANVRFVYAVQAIDTAGNFSPESTRVEETAR